MVRINQSPVFRTAVAGLLLLVAGAVIFYFLSNTTKKGETSKSWPTVKAEVTESRLSSGLSRKRKRKPIITYTYRVDQRDYTGKRVQFGEMSTSRSKAQSIVDKFPVGKVVDLHYNPEDPEEAVLLTGVGPKLVIVKIVSWILLITGICILATIPFEMKRARRHRWF